MSDDFMKRIAPPQADPRLIPEHLLWALTKDGRRAEARTRMVPIDAGKPELRFYVTSRETGELDLRWSRVFDDSRQVGEESEAKKREFEAMGWVDLATETTQTEIPS